MLLMTFCRFICDNWYKILRMKIKIIGAGFSGLALCRHLQARLKNARIEIHDHNFLSGGASSIAAGLLHPYVGQGAKLNWKGKEGMESSTRLLQSVSEDCFRQTGILRLVMKKVQEEEFALSARQHPDVEWKEVAECSTWFPGLPDTPGILIRSGIQVDCREYLSALIRACKRNGAEFVEESCENPLEVQGDLVLLAMGGETPGVKLNLMKGQILRLEWPSPLPPLPCPLIGSCYLVMDKDKRSCWAGSTYERSFEHPGPDLPRAKSELFPKLKETFPPLAEAKILDCQAGVRAFTPDKRPAFRQLDEKTWALTGMGSKGLLYHSLLAEELVEHLIRLFPS